MYYIRLDKWILKLASWLVDLKKQPGRKILKNTIFLFPRFQLVNQQVRHTN